MVDIFIEKDVNELPLAFILYKSIDGAEPLEVVFIRRVENAIASLFDVLKAEAQEKDPRIENFSYIAHYCPEKNVTYDAYGGIHPSNVAAIYSRQFGYHYVYALIDPDSKAPFYIGKGLGNRGAAHEANVISLSVGADEQSKQQWVEDDEKEPKKNACIRKVREKAGDDVPLVRVIGAMIREGLSFDAEAFLIKFVYGHSGDGFNQLTNIQRGHHDARFREKDNWSFNKDLDFQSDTNGKLIPSSPFGEAYYVYVLRDSKTGKTFYVGKGCKNRLLDHFSGASAKTADALPNPVWKRLRNLLDAGHSEADIGKVIAGNLSQVSAFYLETLTINFVYGYNNLENRVHGHHGEHIRRYDNWELQGGLDLRYVIVPGGPRDAEYARFLAAGADLALNRVIEQLRAKGFETPFREGKVEGAGEFAYDATIVSSKEGKPLINLRIQTRNNGKIQVVAMAKGKVGKTYRDRLLIQKGYFPLRRADAYFFPNLWARSASVDVSEGVRRSQVLSEFFINPAQVEEIVLEEVCEGLPDYSRIRWLLRRLRPEENADDKSIKQALDAFKKKRGTFFNVDELSAIRELLQDNTKAKPERHKTAKVKSIAGTAMAQIQAFIEFERVY